MKTLRDIRTCHENRRRLALACAKALEDLDVLQGPAPAYRLYLQAPVGCLDDGTPGVGDLDLLLCRAGDGLAALAIVFDIGDDMVLVPEWLEPLPLRHMALPGELTGDVLQKAAAFARQAAAELPADPGKLDGGTFSLRSRPLGLVLSSSQLPMPGRDTMVRGQLLYPDGAVTPYGASCCLVVRRVRGGDGWFDVLDVAAPRYREIRNALCFSREPGQPGRIPLQDRMREASMGLPPDAAYPGRMASLLDKLLASPINNALWDLEFDGKPEKLLPDRSHPVDTYGGALRLVRDLVRDCLENGWDREKYETAGDTLASLLTWLGKGPSLMSDPVKNRSLRQWMADCRGVQERTLVSGAPLRCYLLGASARLGTGYPCTLCRESMGSSCDSLQSVCTRLTKDWFQSAQGPDAQDRVSRPFLEMYTLLAEPIFPDLDTCTLLRGMAWS